MRKDMGFTYTLRKSRRSKVMRLSVSESGEIRVSSPRWVTLRAIEHFVHSNSEWVMETLRTLKPFAASSASKIMHMQHSRKEYLKIKEDARMLVTTRLAHFNQFYNLPLKEIRIKNQKSRWGSCSAKGNLNFNYRLALVPPHLADYVIVHELCHLAEFNHSKKFWNKVSLQIPEWNRIRKELRAL